MSGHMMSDAEFWFTHLTYAQMEFILDKLESYTHLSYQGKVQYAYDRRNKWRTYHDWPETKMRNV